MRPILYCDSSCPPASSWSPGRRPGMTMAPAIAERRSYEPTIEELELVCLDMAGTTSPEGLYWRLRGRPSMRSSAPADRLAMVEVVVAPWGPRRMRVFRQLSGRGSSAAGQCAFERGYHALVDEEVCTTVPARTRPWTLLGSGASRWAHDGVLAADARRVLAALGWERRSDLCLSPTTRAAGGLPRHDPDRRPAAGA